MGPQAAGRSRVVARVCARRSSTELQASPRAGRPGPNTSYREVSNTRFTVSHDIRLDTIRYDAASDGCFPLISNDRLLSDADVLGAYRYQPNLERRHHLLKGVQHAAPVLLHSPARIEALFCCQFLALLISALIEREIRTGMKQADLAKIGLYPEFRNCTSPSTERILEIFSTVSRHQLHHDGLLVKTFHPELTAQQEQVLELMNLAPSVYTQLTQSPRYPVREVRNVRYRPRSKGICRLYTPPFKDNGRCIQAQWSTSSWPDTVQGQPVPESLAHALTS